MAVREINNKSDGVADHVLPNSRIVVSIKTPVGSFESQRDAIAAATTDFGGTGVHAAFSALGSDEVIAADAQFHTSGIVMAHSVANDARLSDGQFYPYKVQLTAAQAFQGMVLQDILCTHTEQSEARHTQAW